MSRTSNEGSASCRRAARIVASVPSSLSSAKITSVGVPASAAWHRVRSGTTFGASFRVGTTIEIVGCTVSRVLRVVVGTAPKRARSAMFVIATVILPSEVTRRCGSE